MAPPSLIQVPTPGQGGVGRPRPEPARAARPLMALEACNGEVPCPMIWVPGGGVAPAIPNAPRGRPVAIHPWKALQDEGAKVIEASLRSVVGLGADTVADDALFRSRVINVAWDLLPTPVRPPRAAAAPLGRPLLRVAGHGPRRDRRRSPAQGGPARGDRLGAPRDVRGRRPRVRSTSPAHPQPPPRPRPRSGTPSPPGRRPPSASTSAPRSPSSPTSTRPDDPDGRQRRGRRDHAQRGPVRRRRDGRGQGGGQAAAMEPDRVAEFAKRDMGEPCLLAGHQRPTATRPRSSSRSSWPSCRPTPS